MFLFVIILILIIIMIIINILLRINLKKYIDDKYNLQKWFYCIR